MPLIKEKQFEMFVARTCTIDASECNLIGDNRPFLCSFKCGCVYLVFFIHIINDGRACCVANHAYLIVYFWCASAGFLIKVLCLNASFIICMCRVQSVLSEPAHTCVDLFICIAAWKIYMYICVYLLRARLEKKFFHL